MVHKVPGGARLTYGDPESSFPLGDFLVLGSKSEMSKPDRSPDEAEGQTITQSRPTTKRPSLYKVILLNDDYTPMDFVILILRRFFRKGEPDATRIMLEVHNQGAGIAGVFPYEVAETKVYQVNEFSRTNRHPLKCIMEKEVD